jgi:hypothetical protein
MTSLRDPRCARSPALLSGIAILWLLCVARAPAQSVGGDVSASVPEAGAQTSAGALAGATVEPSSGVLRSSLPFGLPAARGTVQPTLALTYSSSAGVREAGLGWGLALPVIERSTKRGAPTLNDDLTPYPYASPPKADELLFNGETIVPACEVGAPQGACTADVTATFPSWVTAGWRYYHLRAGSHYRFFWSPSRATWRIQVPGGEILELGQPIVGALLGTNLPVDPTAAIDFDEIEGITGPGTHRQTVTAARQPFRWNLVRRYSSTVSNSPANVIYYTWARLGFTGRGYLSNIYYSAAPSIPRPTLVQMSAANINGFAYHIALHWKFMPKTASRYTPTWRATPDYVLQGVDVTGKPEHNTSAPREMVRRYHMMYTGTERAFLQSFQLEGRCKSRVVETLGALPVTACPTMPATILTWSGQIPNSTIVTVLPPSALPSPLPPDYQLLPLDLNADGLPDLVEMEVNFTPDTNLFKFMERLTRAPAKSTCQMATNSRQSI